MNINCIKCNKIIYLDKDNIGYKIHCYGKCECCMHYDADYHAKTNKLISEKWFYLNNNDNDTCKIL